MFTDICPGCGNEVEGVFEPSTTRKVFTYLGKKAGVKAVSHIVTGGNKLGADLVEKAINNFAGDVIDEIAEEIADECVDRKLYRFRCGNCGRLWTRTEDMKYGMLESRAKYDQQISIRNWDYDYTQNEPFVEDETILNWSQWIDQKLWDMGKLANNGTEADIDAYEEEILWKLGFIKDDQELYDRLKARVNKHAKEIKAVHRINHKSY